MRLDEPFDALVGRLILLHLTEPAATVRALSRLVRSCGVVSFQEFSMTRARAVPPAPLVTLTRDWIIGAYRATGSDPDVGERVASIPGEAGAVRWLPEMAATWARVP